MRNDEVRPCDVCGGALRAGIPTATCGARVTIQRLVINRGHADAYAGLVTHFRAAGPLGADRMAGLFAPGSVLDEPVALLDEIVICELCFAPVLELVARANERKRAADADLDDRGQNERQADSPR